MFLDGTDHTYLRTERSGVANKVIFVSRIDLSLPSFIFLPMIIDSR